MITENLAGNLFDVYFLIRDLPAWLAHCNDAHFSKEELEYLERLDDEFKDYSPRRDANDWAKEIEKQGGADMYSAETDEEKISLVTRKLIDLSELVNKAFESKNSTPLGLAIMSRKFKEMERLRGKFRARQIHYKFEYTQVTEHAIVRAREYPLEQLIPDQLRNGRMPCPFHHGKDANFSVKNGWGHCFVCDISCDAIKWQMEIRGMSFKSAIESLQ